MPRKNRTDEIQQPENQQGQVTEKTEAPAIEGQDTASAVTIDDFLATLVINPKAHIKTPILVGHWKAWHSENDPQWSVTSRDLLNAFDKLAVKTDEHMTYGAALPTDITADDFLKSSLYFHDHAFMAHEELEAAFWTWWHTQNCPYQVSLSGVMSELQKRGVTPQGESWKGVALRETPEDAKRFPPCSNCGQATWRRHGDEYTCRTCGSTELTLNAKIARVMPLNDTHFYLYTSTQRHVQVLAHVDKTTVPVYGIELQPGIQVKMTGRLVHSPIRGGDPGRFEFEISKMGGSAL